MLNAYTQVPYTSLPFDRSHPEQMAVMGALYGLKPAPPEHCRVLEIACADGGNIIPMACELPDSTFLGFDLAGGVIDLGKRQIAELGLTNIRIEQMDLMDADAGLGTFDYIIAHGLYSWVPEPVRDKLMAIAKSLLAPQGIAYISFNALPGCRIREMLREMLLFHVGGISDPQERIRGAREFLNSFMQTQEQAGGEIGKLLKVEAKVLIDHGPVVLFHDELGEVYHPVYIREFAAHAGRFGLQFLSEASFSDMQPYKIPKDALEQARQWAGDDRILREQYFDFLRGRVFRRVLVCHEGIEVASEPKLDRLPGFLYSSPAEPVSAQPKLDSEHVEEFRGPRGAGAKTAHPLAKAALLSLGRAWPERRSFDDLLSQSCQAAGIPADAEGLVQILSGTLAAGLVDAHTMPSRCVSKPGPFPQTTALARWQARQNRQITTLRHTNIEVEGGVERRLLAVLDGTHDMPGLVRELAPLLPDSPEQLARRIQENLNKLARFGLLVG